ncbi:hexameric tyrosine-coordinated heme protein [Pollutimonas nitritireducens]|nr:hexameric tyrosine-coordinated heme protein [Pollutimonas nitritireducens]
MNTTVCRQYKCAPKRFFFTSLLTAAMAIGYISIAIAQDKPEMKAGLTTLITDTPEAGFALAVKLSQKGVATTQTDPAIRKALRPSYAHDANSLIAVSHVVATHFQTIAAANDYWRK